MFKNLKEDVRYTINNTEFIFHFLPRVGSADHSAAQKGTGSKCGGKNRCEKCGASFTPENLGLLFHYDAMQQSPQKDLQSQLELFRQPNAKQLADDIGLKTSHPLLNNDYITPLEVSLVRVKFFLIMFKERMLHEYEQCPDNLHNLKETIKLLVSFERAEKDWNERSFLTSLQLELHRTGIIVYKQRLILFFRYWIYEGHRLENVTSKTFNIG